MRDFIAEWEKTYADDFVRVPEEIDPQHQISAFVKKLDTIDRYPIIIFENVKGHKTPVA